MEESLALLSAVADPVRWAVQHHLGLRGKPCVCDLQERVPVAPNLLSYHLKVLRDAGLVTTARRGRWVDHSLAEGAADRLLGALPFPLREGSAMSLVDHMPSSTRRGSATLLGAVGARAAAGHSAHVHDGRRRALASRDDPAAPRPQAQRLVIYIAVVGSSIVAVGNLFNFLLA